MEDVLNLEQQNSRQLNQDKRKTTEARVIDEVKKQIVRTAKQATLRTINVAFAATLVGLVVTYAIMSFQAFVGNLMGAESIKLEGWELAIWAILSILFIFLLVSFITFVGYLANPWHTAILGFQEVLDWLTGN